MSRINSVVHNFPLAVLLVALMIPAATVHSAVLTEIRTDHVVIDGGERIESPELMSLRVTPDEIEFQLWQSNIQTPSEIQGESSNPQVAYSAGSWEIEPEAGEEVGDSVCYFYELTQTATTSVDGDALAVAEVGAGTGSSADADVDPLFVDANVETDFSIQVNGQAVVGPHGRISISGNAADSSDLQGHFLAQIGDELSFSHAGANAAAAAYPGTAEIDVFARVFVSEVSLLNCPPAFGSDPGAPGPVALTGLAGGTASEIIEITNTGDAGSLLDVSLDSISADYSVVAGLPIAGLEATDPAAEIVIECNPPQVTGSLVLATNDPDNDTITYDLECMLETFTVGGMVSGLEGNQVVLQNNGGDDQVITTNGGFTFSPQADGTDYEVTVATQPGDPSQTCTVSNSSGTLSGDDVNDIEVICGTILVEIDQAALDFGNVTLDKSETQTILVTNSGGAELLISAISNPGAPFFLVGGSCLAVPVTLAPMETCTIDVQFLPEEDGSFTSFVQIESNADSSPDSVTLNGTGMPVLPVPTLGHWALIVLMLSLLLVAGGRLRMR